MPSKKQIRINSNIIEIVYVGYKSLIVSKSEQKWLKKISIDFRFGGWNEKRRMNVYNCLHRRMRHVTHLPSDTLCLVTQLHSYVIEFVEKKNIIHLSYEFAGSRQHEYL